MFGLLSFFISGILRVIALLSGSFICLVIAQTAILHLPHNGDSVRASVGELRAEFTQFKSYLKAGLGQNVAPVIVNTIVTGILSIKQAD